MKRFSLKKGYSVIASVLMVGFLLILASGVFHLVLLELQDNRGREDYLKASQAAEGALELALLRIKEKGYGYYGNIEGDVNNQSIILSRNPLNTSMYSGQDSLLSYSMDSRVLSYSGQLAPLGYDIIPLFSFDDTKSYTVDSMTLEQGEGQGILTWNMVSTENGISGQGSFDDDTLGILRDFDESGGFTVSDKSVSQFLGDDANTNNYLILLNSSPDETVEYILSSNGEEGYFTKPRLTLVSSGKNTKFKQNLRTVLDNTEYLSILRYSIFSDN